MPDKKQKSYRFETARTGKEALGHLRLNDQYKNTAIIFSTADEETVEDFCLAYSVNVSYCS